MPTALSKACWEKKRNDMIHIFAQVGLYVNHDCKNIAIVVKLVFARQFYSRVLRITVGLSASSIFCSIE